MKKVPMRCCVATKELCPKIEMIRVVKNNAGEIFVDPTSKANGHGAYIKCTQEAIEIARKTKCLERALKCTIEESVYNELQKYIKN